MTKNGITRRAGILGVAAAGFAVTHPAWAQQENGEATPPVETKTGRVRGKRAHGVSKFLGIPYGADTSAHRFQPAQPAAAWTGVRDCFLYGDSAFQNGDYFSRPGVDAEKMNQWRTLFMSGATEQIPTESENCLVLNVWTPDASAARKRPVMFYLHGGGFAQGSGSSSAYDGTALARRGDVVVVTINHRLNALGYLYLGGISDDFADSGNVGQLDQILALQWVRDNISAFGGDPGNVVIFGQSGGGSKVSTLLAMPGAKGLFHKAIIQSGPGLKMAERADANALAERTLAALGIAKADVHRLQTLDPKVVIKTAIDAQAGGAGRTLSPTVDGRSLPRHPFDPDAPDTARGIPLMIGTCKDEQTVFMYLDPDFGHMTADQARVRFDKSLHDRGAAAFDFFRNRRPNDSPTYWWTSMLSDSGTWINSIRLAERKVAQQAGPVFMYRVDWETPVLNGALRTPHGTDTSLVFDNASRSRGLVGPAPAPDHIGAEMSQACANFAHTGDPSQPALSWPRYDVATRKTMIFNVPSHVVEDPDHDVRTFFTA